MNNVDNMHYIIISTFSLCVTLFQQMHTDAATGQLHGELQDGVAALEEVVTSLQELSVKLRDQSQ